MASSAMLSPGLEAKELKDASIGARDDKPSPSSSETESGSPPNSPQNIPDSRPSPNKPETRAVSRNEPCSFRASQQPNTDDNGIQMNPTYWSSSHPPGFPFLPTTVIPQGAVGYFPGRFNTVPGWPGNRPDAQTYQTSYSVGLNALSSIQAAAVPQAGIDMSLYSYLQGLD
jgi:hypothetical protein